MSHKRLHINIQVERTDDLNVDYRQMKKVTEDVRAFLKGKGYKITDGTVKIS